MDSTAQSNLVDDEHYASSFAAFLARLDYPDALFPWLDERFDGAGVRSLLCVGAGTGSVELPLIRRLPDVERVTLIEPNPHHADALEQALDVLAEERARPDLCAAVVRELFERWEPPRSATHDLILFCNSLYFLASPGQMLERALGMLSPRGRVLIIHEHPAGAMAQIQTRYHAAAGTAPGRDTYYTAADILGDLLALQARADASIGPLNVRLEVEDAVLDLGGYPRRVLEFIFEAPIESDADLEHKRTFVQQLYPSPRLPQPYSIITVTRP